MSFQDLPLELKQQIIIDVQPRDLMSLKEFAEILKDDPTFMRRWMKAHPSYRDLNRELRNLHLPHDEARILYILKYVEHLSTDVVDNILKEAIELDNSAIFGVIYESSFRKSSYIDWIVYIDDIFDNEKINIIRYLFNSDYDNVEELFIPIFDLNLNVRNYIISNSSSDKLYKFAKDLLRYNKYTTFTLLVPHLPLEYNRKLLEILIEGNSPAEVIKVFLEQTGLNIENVSLKAVIKNKELFEKLLWKRIYSRYELLALALTEDIPSCALAIILFLGYFSQEEIEELADIYTTENTFNLLVTFRYLSSDKIRDYLLKVNPNKFERTLLSHEAIRRYGDIGYSQCVDLETIQKVTSIWNQMK